MAWEGLEGQVSGDWPPGRHRWKLDFCRDHSQKWPEGGSSRSEEKTKNAPWEKPTVNPAGYFCFPGGTVVKNLSANAGDSGDAGLIPRSGSSPGVGNGDPLLHSCLEDSMDRGAWWATVYGVAKSRTWLSAHTQSTSGIDHLGCVVFIHVTKRGMWPWNPVITRECVPQESISVQAVMLQ